mmetsp:Transcript_121011/g.353603  ORF Transcript_121011/g.353603 Transcript_121011/m.353603 type:complete len:271 (+) Transcript_121011:178-990(+)
MQTSANWATALSSTARGRLLNQRGTGPMELKAGNEAEQVSIDGALRTTNEYDLPRGVRRRPLPPRRQPLRPGHVHLVLLAELAVKTVGQGLVDQHVAGPPLLEAGEEHAAAGGQAPQVPASWERRPGADELSGGLGAGVLQQWQLIHEDLAFIGRAHVEVAAVCGVLRRHPGQGLDGLDALLAGGVSEARQAKAPRDPARLVPLVLQDGRVPATRAQVQVTALRAGHGHALEIQVTIGLHTAVDECPVCSDARVAKVSKEHQALPLHHDQ